MASEEHGYLDLVKSSEIAGYWHRAENELTGHSKELRDCWTLEPRMSSLDVVRSSENGRLDDKVGKIFGLNWFI
jgi:hypothetical protein